MEPTIDDKLHVAVIMDGNGRWARRRGLPRTAGHRRGAKAAREVIEASPDLGIGRLTLFAFSSDNWKRPKAEVATLMNLFRKYLREELSRCLDNGVRLTFIGRRDRLAEDLKRGIREAEEATGDGKTLHLRIAVDYSARDAIARAAGSLDGHKAVPRETLDGLLAPDIAAGDGSPQVDLLIRTGGEQRLSDFLLWECAYAELFFTPTMWPDFGRADLAEAVAEFHRRSRRFGRVPDEAPSLPGLASIPLAAAGRVVN